MIPAYSTIDGSALTTTLLQAIAKPDLRRIAAPNWLEAAMVVGRRDGASARSRFEPLPNEFDIEAASPNPTMAHLAAFQRDRRRSKHAAHASAGGRRPSAPAKHTGAPLPSQPNDAPHSGITPALA